MSLLELRIPPPVVTFATAGGMWLAGRLLPALAITIPERLELTLACAAAGSAICATALAAFGKARTTVSPLRPQDASSVVSSGIYHYTRNPMYLGMLLMLMAWGLWLSHGLALLLLPAFVLYMNRFQIAPEERALSAKFGAAYEDYRCRVRRWL